MVLSLSISEFNWVCEMVGGREGGREEGREGGREGGEEGGSEYSLAIVDHPSNSP